jgi:hypothetical protein
LALPLGDLKYKLQSWSEFLIKATTALAVDIFLLDGQRDTRHQKWLRL